MLYNFQSDLTSIFCRESTVLETNSATSISKNGNAKW